MWWPGWTGLKQMERSRHLTCWPMHQPLSFPQAKSRRPARSCTGAYNAFIPQTSDTCLSENLWDVCIESESTSLLLSCRRQFPKLGAIELVLSNGMKVCHADIVSG